MQSTSISRRRTDCIEALHVWIETYADDSEGVVMARNMPLDASMGSMPLMSTRRDTAESLGHIAQLRMIQTRYAEHPVKRVTLRTYRTDLVNSHVLGIAAV